MNPYTTATKNVAACSIVLDGSANETADMFHALISDSGVKPSKAILAARDDINAIAAEETQQLADIENLRDRDGLDLTEALAVLTQSAAGTNTRTIDDAARVSAAHTLLGTSAPERAKTYIRMERQARFRRAREATYAMRKLNDGLITGLLDPWAQRISAELEPLAAVVVAKGWPGLVEAEQFRRESEPSLDEIRGHASAPGAYKTHLQLLRASELVAEFEHVTGIAHGLRERGLIPTAAAPIDGRFYSFTDLSKLPEPKYMQARTVWWVSTALVDGAGLAVRTARDAEKAATRHMAEAS